MCNGSDLMEVICSCIMTSTYSILHINHIGARSVSMLRSISCVTISHAVMFFCHRSVAKCGHSMHPACTKGEDIKRVYLKSRLLEGVRQIDCLLLLRLLNPHTDLQKNSHFRNLRGPADPKNCMSWYKRYAKP